MKYRFYNFFEQLEGELEKIITLKLTDKELKIIKEKSDQQGYKLKQNISKSKDFTMVIMNSFNDDEIFCSIEQEFKKTDSIFTYDFLCVGYWNDFIKAEMPKEYQCLTLRTFGV